MRGFCLLAGLRSHVILFGSELQLPIRTSDETEQIIIFGILVWGRIQYLCISVDNPNIFLFKYFFSLLNFYNFCFDLLYILQTSCGEVKRRAPTLPINQSLADSCDSSPVAAAIGATWPPIWTQNSGVLFFKIISTFSSNIFVFIFQSFLSPVV